MATKPNVVINDENSRGLPYYEKLRKDLRETLQKKRLLDKNISLIEDQIYKFETSYLEETPAGNIIKGFDNYIKGSSTGTSTLGTTTMTAASTGTGTSTRRKGNTIEPDRLFSRSSVNYLKEASPGPSESGRDTPRKHADDDAPAGKSGTNSAAIAQNLKKKKKGASGTTSRKDSEDDGVGEKAPKRLKITYARGGD